jgi:predicted DNA-binding WGR domain protein
MPLHLEQIDPSRNRARFYRMEVGRDLFGVWTLHRSWGRIGTNGRARIESYASRAEAVTAWDRLAWAKRRRGYDLVGQGDLPDEAG